MNTEFKGVLEGLRVLDFSWALAGPTATRCLADFGATVIRVESKVRPDVNRTAAPFFEDKPGLDRSGFYAQYSCNKYSMALNLACPGGREVARKLVSWADLVCENFGPGTMDKWGLGYVDVSRLKPDIIMMSSSLQGQTGPHRHYRGYATQQIALSGLGSVTGWPDRLPSQVPAAYADIVAALAATIAIVAALDYRRRTGRGRYIDISQLETTVHLLTPALLDYTANGREALRTGNRCDHAAPHGVYPCQGDDSWCAIAVFSDDEWQNFCQCIGTPSWTREPRFATLLSRKKNEEELDRLIAEWTCLRSSGEVMTLLQAGGVAAGIVRSPADLLNDPQLLHRDFFWVFDRPGVHHVLNWAFRLSETPAKARTPFPRLGEHTEFVCREILGMGDQDFIKLLQEGVFE